MKLWVTGANGLVGTALTKLCEGKIPYVATSHATVDITSLHEIKKFLQSPEGKGVTHIINCAAYTNVDQAEKEPALAHLVNVVGPENLGNVCRSLDLRLVHLSTDYVFGSEGGHPFSEDDPCQPVSVYAKTKWEGEQRLQEVFPQACILRTSWVFGPGGKNFVSAIFEKIQKEEKIYVSNDQRNRVTYVKDLADAILALLCHSGTFHFANQGEISRFDVAQKMVQTARMRGLPVVCREIIGVKAEMFSQGAKRPLYSVLDTTKIESLGVPNRSWESALTEFFHAV